MNSASAVQPQFDAQQQTTGEVNIPICRTMFGPEEYAAIRRPLDDGWVVQGPAAKFFEQQFGSYVRSPFALTCSSGTAALHIAVAAMGLQPGDEVIVPGFTWVATANVVELTGAKPVFCDIELNTFNISPSEIRSHITDRTVGIIPVHLFGWTAEMDEILPVAAEHKLWVVEDAACALGSFYNGRHAGTIGDIGCFSFHPRKTITTGEGGMLTVADKAVARQCDAFRNHGAVAPTNQESRYAAAYDAAGLNYRLTDIQAALGAAQLDRVDFFLSERRRCANFYTSHLHDVDFLWLPKPPKHITHGWQSYVTLYAPETPTLENVDELHRQRNLLMKHLEDRGISTRPGTHAPPHLNFYANKYQITPEACPASYIAERLSLALPLYPELPEEHLSYICSKIREFHKGS